VGLNRLENDPLEYAFGRTRIGCRDVCTMKKMNDSFPANISNPTIDKFLMLTVESRHRVHTGVSKRCKYTPCSRCCVSESLFSTYRCIARTQPILAALMERWRGHLVGLCIDVHVIVQRLSVKVTLWKNLNSAS
jgi:hypothetical protein